MEKDVEKEMEELVGKSYPLMQQLKMGGNGSPRLVISGASDTIKKLLEKDSYLNYCNIELRKQLMREIKKEEIIQMEKIFRLNLINSVTGYKPANLVGTRAESGTSNLSIISSVIHLGSNPALLGFLLRPALVPRHTYTNIKETGFYTINHVWHSAESPA